MATTSSAGPADDAPCIYDATVTDGLPELQRTDPGWRERLWSGVRRRPTRDLTVGDWLRCGAGGDLLPRSPEDEAWIRRRRLAAGWLEWVDGTPLANADEAWLVEVAARRLGGSPPSSKGTWTKACSLLRRWVRSGQQRLRLEVRVQPAWSRIPTSGTLSTCRDIPALETVHRLIAGTEDLELRALIGLVVSGRLLPSEALRLRHEDLDLDLARVQVHAGARRGRPAERCARSVPIPAWVVDLMRDAWSGAGRGWCFPHRRDPERHASRADGRLARLATRIGRPGVTFADLRRLGQGLARSADGSRALVRGVVRTVGVAGIINAEERVFELEQRELAHAWPELAQPPVRPAAVPVRSPTGCAPTTSEIAASRKRVAARFGGRAAHQDDSSPLPRSCRWPGRPAGGDKAPILRVVHALREQLDATQRELDEESWLRAEADERADEATLRAEEATAELEGASRPIQTPPPSPRDRPAGELAVVGLVAASLGAIGVQALERLLRGEGER